LKNIQQQSIADKKLKSFDSFNPSKSDLSYNNDEGRSGHSFIRRLKKKTYLKVL